MLLNNRLSVMFSSGIKTRPRAFSEMTNFTRNAKEFFSCTAKKLDEQEMIEGMLGMFGRTYQS
jgi:hypothetical protein